MSTFDAVFVVSLNIYARKKIDKNLVILLFFNYENKNLST